MKILLSAGALAIGAGLLVAPAAQAAQAVDHDITVTGVPALVKAGQSITLEGKVKVRGSGAPAAGVGVAIYPCTDAPWEPGDGPTSECESSILLKTGSDGSYRLRTKIPAETFDSSDEQYYEISLTGPNYAYTTAIINYASKVALTVKASKRVKRGHAAVVAGSLKYRVVLGRKPKAQWRPQAGVAGRVYFRAKGSAKWFSVGRVKTNAKGGFKLAFKDRKDGHVQVRFPQTGVTFAVNSAKHFVDVR